jgi:hypothetical protein
LQPDIPEEDELEVDGMAFEVVAKLDLKNDTSVYEGAGLPLECEKKEKRLAWLWVGRLITLHDNISSLCTL